MVRSPAAKGRDRLRGALVVVALLAAATAGSVAHAARSYAGVDDYPTDLRTAAQDSLVDPWRFYNRECTSFVAWRMNRDGHAFSNFMTGPNGKAGHFGNAGNWDDNAIAIGFTVNTTPTVGSIAQWNGGEIGGSTLGHVAYVEAVNADGSVTVEEYNYSTRGVYDERFSVRAPRYIHIGPPLPAVSIGSELRSEGGRSPAMLFWIHLSVPTTVPVTVHWTTQDGTAKAGSDYVAASGDATFAPGQTAYGITVNVLNDFVHEPTETFRIVLTQPPNATLKSSGTNGTIVDDD